MTKQLDMVSAESWSSEPFPLLRPGLLKYNLCTIKFTSSTGFHKYISLCNPHHHQYVERYYRHPHTSLSSQPQPLVTTDLSSVHMDLPSPECHPRGAHRMWPLEPRCFPQGNAFEIYSEICNCFLCPEPVPSGCQGLVPAVDVPRWCHLEDKDRRKTSNLDPAGLPDCVHWHRRQQMSSHRQSQVWEGRFDCYGKIHKCHYFSNYGLRHSHSRC